MSGARVGEIWRESRDLKDRFFEAHADEISAIALRIARSLSIGGKLLLCGNGGSAADAQHVAAELVGRFKRKDRPPLPAIALTTDTSALTALANDFGFERVFELQVRALASRGDVLVVLSTSGNSPNVIAAARAARERGAWVAGLLGGDGGAAKSECDAALVVPHGFSARVQEVHIMVGHILCELVEEDLAREAKATP